MMGRLSCTEEPEPRTVFPADHFMNLAKNIPQHQKEVSFPSIPSNDIRSQSSQLHRNYFAEKPPDRAQSAFQESSYRVPDPRDIQRTATVTPNLKLPPIHPHSSAPQEAVMPPLADVPLQGDRYPAYPDLSAAYDNMMVGYFMSPNAKVDNYLPYKQQDIQLSTEGFHSSGQQICHSNYVFPPTLSNQLLQGDPMLDPVSPSQISMQKGQNFRIQNAPASQAGRKNQLQRSKNSIPGDNHPPLNRHTAMDITSSGCTVLDASAFHPDHKHAAFGDVPKPDHPPKPLSGDQQPSTYADLSTVLDDISMFITPQHTPVMRPESDHRTFSAMAGTTYSNHQYQPKTDPTFGRYSVLPPVMSSATPGGGDGDNLSMLSYASVPAQSTYCAPFFAAADSSPRYSGRSSYSGRSVRNGKRALSNSPLDGIDLNALIRMSPTSLVAYINGSRSSSSSSPGGCYGHLSARTSPGSGSSSGHHRRGSAFDLDDNLLVIQAMRDIEASAADVPELPPEFDNLQVMRQDLAAGDFLLPPVAHCKPPPTYDQHMARKAVLQKNSSSDSSQPSNSSSFESSEGDKTVGSSGTDTEGATRMYACRWLDCTAVFQDQDEFVTHIEKLHIDQKKGEDFICFWKLCPRRLHPFNARYKLLVHMRIHSGDKPNKCTFAGCQKAFSRLENLKIHLRSHTGERPYSCVHPGCTKTFSNSSDRTKHQKTHNDTKPYVCQIVGCGKRYTDPSSLRKHIKKSHPEKKEPDRKKIRGGAEELDPKDLSECLVIQAIKPITLCDTSPPEPTDSGLGRSPRSSQPGSSSDHYPGLVYSGETFPGSDIVHNNCHTSPSSHNSSPRAQNDSDIISLNNNLRVPILPLLTPQNKNYSQAQKTPTFRNSSVF